MLRPRGLPSLQSFWLLLLLFGAFFESSAQLQTGNIQDYVTYPDDRAPTIQLKVALIGNGNQVGETYTDDHGLAQFLNVAIGSYQVSITGDGIQSTLSDVFDVDARRVAQSVFVRVRPSKDEQSNAGPGGSSAVAAGDLKIPKNASQEFDKATQFIAKEQWQKAIERLNRAVALYPGYAQAYNNLGVVYARLGDTDKEKEALQKAIAANSRFAPALVNLARMEMKTHDFVAADGHLQQATSANPTDVRTIVLLAQVQLMEAHYEDAIASARKVHSMAHESYAQVHYVAARACERLNRLGDAISELKLFLSEEPSGDRASAARQEMAAIQKVWPPSR